MRASFVFSEVITGLRRNVTMTIAMILTTAISLGMLGGGLLVVRTIDKMNENYRQDIEVTIYLTDDVSRADQSCTQDMCRELRSSLESASNVEEVEFENRQQAYERYKRIFADDPALLEAARPDALPASLQVKLFDPERGGAIVQEFSGRPGVDKVEDQQEFLSKFFGVLNSVRDATFIVALIQAFAALLLISNAVQLSAFSRRTEVGIMRLVGATRWYTQLPFLLEAVVTGIIGWVLATGGLIVAKYAFIDGILSATANIIPSIQLVDIMVVSPWLLLASVVISAITGYLTLRMYVRN